MVDDEDFDLRLLRLYLEAELALKGDKEGVVGSVNSSRNLSLRRSLSLHQRSQLFRRVMLLLDHQLVEGSLERLLVVRLELTAAVSTLLLRCSPANIAGLVVPIGIGPAVD